jgi:hypothetical protein
MASPIPRCNFSAALDAPTDTSTSSASKQALAFDIRRDEGGFSHVKHSLGKDVPSSRFLAGDEECHQLFGQRSSDALRKTLATVDADQSRTKAGSNGVAPPVTYRESPMPGEEETAPVKLEREDATGRRSHQHSRGSTFPADERPARKAANFRNDRAALGRLTKKVQPVVSSGAMFKDEHEMLGLVGTSTTRAMKEQSR